jgi:hypothetical protein
MSLLLLFRSHGGAEATPLIIVRGNDDVPKKRKRKKKDLVFKAQLETVEELTEKINEVPFEEESKLAKLKKKRKKEALLLLKMMMEDDFI